MLLLKLLNPVIPFIRSIHWLKITEYIEYKLPSLTYKILTTRVLNSGYLGINMTKNLSSTSKIFKTHTPCTVTSNVNHLYYIVSPKNPHCPRPEVSAGVSMSWGWATAALRWMMQTKGSGAKERKRL